MSRMIRKYQATLGRSPTHCMARITPLDAERSRWGQWPCESSATHTEPVTAWRTTPLCDDHAGARLDQPRKLWVDAEGHELREAAPEIVLVPQPIARRHGFMAALSGPAPLPAA